MRGWSRHVAALLLAWGLALGWTPSPALRADGPRYLGRPLVEVLRGFRQQGLELIFSSAVVPDDLRVTVEPSASEPRAALEQMLAPLGLRLEEGPRGALLILRAETRGATLTGRVVSAASGSPVAGADVRLGGVERGAVTDARGIFELRDVPPGVYSLTVKAVGFASSSIRRIRLTTRPHPPVYVELAAHPAFVTEVVVTPGRHSLVREEQFSKHALSGEDAVLAPTIGDDVSRLVELLPGVAAPDNSAALNVRGSTAQDVSLVLDGLELYDPFHLQSFQSPFTVVDSNTVDRIDFLGGGFTADLGDRHGGFVMISTVAPERGRAGAVELGTLNSRVSFLSPLSGGNGSVLASARNWYPEALGNNIEVGRGEELEPQFGDFYAKAAWAPAPGLLLSIHGLGAYDRLAYDETGQQVNESVDALTRNGYLWVRLLTAGGESWSSETVLSAGRIDRERRGLSTAGSDVTVVDDLREVDFVGLRHDSAWQLTDRHLLKAGIDLHRLTADYRYSNRLPDDPASSIALALDPEGVSGAVYAAWRSRLLPKLTAEAGFRWDRQTYTDDDQPSPRLNAVWRPRERTELRVAVGRFNQSQRIHELRLPDGETEFGRAEVAEQAELSFQHGLVSGIRLRLDAYHRRLTRLRPRYENLFEPVELFPETAEDRVEIAPSKARLRGLEVLVRGDESRRLFWWASYALSSAEDRIGVEWVPRSWDQTHAGKLLVGYRRDDRWSVSLSGSIHTGWPTTPVTAELSTLPDGSTELEAVPGERNSVRFSTYARVDLKLLRSFALARGRLTLTLEVVNLLDRRNPRSVDEFVFEPRPDGSYDAVPRYDSWLGITPSFSLLWEF